MAITVKFVSGEEREYDADTASLANYGRLFVLHKWKGRKLESANTFRADQVAWARKPNGEIVIGRGRVDEDE